MTPQVPDDFPIHEGQDDYIRDESLVKLAGFYEEMPQSWDLGSMQCSQRSVTATIRFDGVTLDGQALALERCLAAASCFGALVRNLRWEREQRAARSGGVG